MRLSELQTGDKAYIKKVNGNGGFRKRILEMGFVRGEEVKSVLNAPLKDPIKYEIMDYEVSLRRSEAVMIEISILKEEIVEIDTDIFSENGHPQTPENDTETKHIRLRRRNRNFSLQSPKKTINVALVGNPNSGKTSIFNLASGAHEHVGNYSGVTVDSKEGKLYHNGYTFKLVDLPGTYSLAAYTPEELYVRRYVVTEQPDVIINVVAAPTLKRNLYLTTELIDMNIPMVMALNMYDELEESGREFDYDTLGKMMGIPMVPTVGKKGQGIPQLLNEVIKIFESGDNGSVRPDIPYGRVLEKSIAIMEREFNNKDISHLNLPVRYISIKLLEGDKEVEDIIKQQPGHLKVLSRRDKERAYIERLLREDTETAFTNARYGYVEGGLKETLSEQTHFSNKTRILDAIVTNKYIGFPVFFLFMWVMFEATFKLGAYPQGWIESLVQVIGNWVRANMADGPLKDLIADGIIGGVGGVIVFLPNIVILYLFIAFMEDSGYMSRAAFIMDKVMHKMGLHGKSFIPLIMGFGCNIPAIMSTRTIESRSSRIITMLIVPFMSCSARLPVYLLLVGAFFSEYASIVLLGLYLVGIFIAVFTARMFRKTIFTKEDTPFVMELPPYRIPTIKSVFTHMWDRSNQYLKKMGGPILIASMIIWFLGYFPLDRGDAGHPESKIEHQENSYIGKIGKSIEPIMKPLGFDWKISVSLLSGMAAKEIVISTMSVLYTGSSENQESLQDRLSSESYADGAPVFTPLVVIGFLLFVLLYFPCISTIAAIKEESGSWKWALFSIFYSTGLAWLIAFLVYQVGSMFIS